jgi:hypothetical protein
MKKIISHRGNVNGPNKKRENRISSIVECLNLGFDVEIDVFLINQKLYLGHDEPQEEILPNFLDEHKKNLQEAITSGVNSKDKELAEQKLNEIYTLLDTLVSDLTNVINGLPDGKVLVMSNISGYQINLYDNGDPRVSYGTTGDNQKY